MPKTFFANQRKKLPERVTLKGPGGNTWEVGLTVKSGILFFDQGWEVFVKDHSLKERDLLVFKYNGVSHFEVMIFDGETFCEKTTSYFVKKSGGKDPDNGFHLKRRLGGNPSGVIMATPVGQFRDSSLEKTDADVINTPLSFGVVHDAPYISLRKLVTEGEKKKALQLAQEAVTLEGFYVIMKPTHVYRKFFMSIPCGWMNKHLNMLLKHPVSLKMNGKTWNTRFVYQQARKSGGLSAGWRSFAVDNNLQEFDVCVFNPEAPFHTSMSLNVNVVRAIEDE
ncbi:B3 domain-containing protein REM16 [Linum perenne]